MGRSFRSVAGWHGWLFDPLLLQYGKLLAALLPSRDEVLETERQAKSTVQSGELESSSTEGLVIFGCWRDDTSAG